MYVICLSRFYWYQVSILQIFNILYVRLLKTSEEQYKIKFWYEASTSHPYVYTDSKFEIFLKYTYEQYNSMHRTLFPLFFQLIDKN